MTRRGFSMVELVVALAISSLLLGAIASLFVLQSRAMPDGTSVLSRENAASAGIARFAFDLSRATFVNSATLARVELVVSDCTGDGVDDLVVYTWAGTGQPWVRTLNASMAETVCDQVGGLSIVWRVRSVAAPAAIKTVEGAEVRITSSDARARAVEGAGRAVCHARLP